ncbi:hypothetical protein OMR58_01110 (plasmid) [Erwinia sp. INIA-01]|uniref:hypothetical protein n=1 Tax=Erwinia sp. INIA01 TaxID=2991500 RepID=UPI002224B6A6|nr:hypothetical protein [Erwinia sp. INIA01]MCW1873040.1 hypothetical protein [Erwinia sp. INIA01]
MAAFDASLIMVRAMAIGGKSDLRSIVHILYALDRRMTSALRSFLDFCMARFG